MLIVARHPRILVAPNPSLRELVIPDMKRLVRLAKRLFNMNLGNSAESDILKLFFQNTNMANVGDATGLRGSSTAGSLYISLHTASPGQTGTENTSEAAYTSYARVGVARSSSGWTITGSNPTTSENAAAITFPACTGGSETETYTAAGQETSGAGELYWFGALSANLAVSNGITPSYAINAFQCTLQ